MNLLFWKKKTGVEKTGDDEAGDLPVPEIPAKPGFMTQIKAKLAVLLKKKTSLEEDDDDEADDSTGGGVSAESGLLLRIKAGLAAFSGKFRPRAASVVENDQSAASSGDSKKVSDDTGVNQSKEAGSEEAPEARPPRSKKLLIAGGAFGLTVILLIGIWYTIWPIITPSKKTPDAKTDIAPAASGGIKMGKVPEKTRTETDAPKKENAELQPRLEASAEEVPQSAVQPDIQSARKAPLVSSGGEISIGNNDPKAAAMTLKEAIEAMNAQSDGYKKKPAENK